MTDIERIKQAVLKKGYIWYTDRPNIIGIRTKLQVPNVFNDVLYMEYEGNEFVATITTEPGSTMLTKPMNVKGAAILKPGQYVNCWTLGFHKQRADHKALIQTKSVTVYRDNDKDNIAEYTKTEETGTFGINIHGTKPGRDLNIINDFSAGCQVFQLWDKKEEFISILEKYKHVNLSQFTYTLLEEGDLE